MLWPWTLQNIHCIGDKANRLALDIFQELIEEKAVNVSAWRPRIEHAQIIEEHDLKRFGKLGGVFDRIVMKETNRKWYYLQWLQAFSLHTRKLIIIKVSVFYINILKDVWYVVCRGTTSGLLLRLICRSLLIVRLKGPNRMQGAYAYASLLRLEFLCTSLRPKPNRWPSLSGQTILPLGSDFPIEGVNPLLGFYAAVKRLAIDGSSPHGHSGW